MQPPADPPFPSDPQPPSDPQHAADRPDPEARRAALVAGPPLADLDAALGCACACHPRPAGPLHDGGTDCHCQLTAAERRERMDQAIESLRAALEPVSAANRRARGEMARLAVELGVTATVACSMCPLVVTGHCDGHAFYLRERHGEYRVTVSADPTDADLWTAEDAPASVDITYGIEDAIYDAGEHPYPAALRLAVAAVRSWLRQTGCDHAARGSWPFCPSCGTPAG